MGLFEIKDLTYFYPEVEKPSLKEVNLQIEEGEFVFLIGPSGCGKSSLLRAMAGLLPDYYGGKIGGEICYAGSSLVQWDKRQLAKEVGMIFQDPEKQMVMTAVKQEIAFGLENIQVPYQEMRRRIAEVLALFGISSLKDQNTFHLSGGQKQKVVLASILAMHPRVLLLDEPTSQLDPLAAQELLNYVQRLNMEWGLTVVLVEQRIDRCFHLADRVIFMENGKILKSGSPRKMVEWAAEKYPQYIPPVSQFFSKWRKEDIPLTIKEGRRLLNTMASKDLIKLYDEEGGSNEAVEILKLSNLCSTYNKKDFVLNKINLQLYEKNITVILGENGAGKSTLLKTISGLLRPVKGKIVYKGRDISHLKPEKRALDIGYLSQNPNDYLFHDTVEEEIAFNLKVRGEKDDKKVEEILILLNLKDKRRMNPRDLSGGERQRVALGTVLVTSPDILLLDEPTRGLDVSLKDQLKATLQLIKEKGTSILMVTHDVEFAAEISDRVMIMAEGEIVADGKKREVLANSLYYAPQINRLFKGISDKVLNIDESIQVISKVIEQPVIG
ncbi:ABC transporter ATP-binding protein [Clostridium formicaceticum]|uniref:ABC transporter n=1 Tax=Clostridium formicaceticum TaxID=1497 RepID=A0AAC9WHZ5_9CLOT|nr:energy-coupling factor transporter ATPase [Clostridium formicaceticum]AOY77660.1 ABC transporter [Clostridium formicaceticum]ARE88245.1 Putative HMP/thiamine import ATP-binding protein YkoD [Clostridium formicaceticum]